MNVAPYVPAQIEPKWQQLWDEQHAFRAENDSDKPKYYCLIEFPYPSGQGLHVGHPRHGLRPKKTAALPQQSFCLFFRLVF